MTLVSRGVILWRRIPPGNLHRLQPWRATRPREERSSSARNRSTCLAVLLAANQRQHAGCRAQDVLVLETRDEQCMGQGLGAVRRR